MKTFISFVGSNDAGKLIDKSEDGAILTILNSKRFDSIYLLFNSNEFVVGGKKITYLQIAEYLKDEIIKRKLCSKNKIYIEEIKFVDIADHSLVYPILLEFLKSRFKQSSSQSLYAGISSGTPSMQTSWILIAETDSFSIKLLRSVESKHSKKGERVFEVNLLTGTKEKIIQLEKFNKLIGPPRQSDIFTVSDAMNLSDKQIRISKTNEHVLILGETGTGKELLAKSIHQNSNRSRENMFELNCAGLNENLLESELFGSIKGAFTGADKDKVGIVETYSKGTLFLDEINSMPLSVQAKLLRFLENGEYRKVGSIENKTSQTRIIAASNENLNYLVELGKFRSDLYFRLRTYEFRIPPLRERKNDISEFVDRLNENGLKFTPQALETLINHPFKGNIRELKIILARLVHFTNNKEVNEKILSEVLSDFKISQIFEKIEIPENLYGKVFEIVKNVLANTALEIANGNSSEAARILGVTHPSIKKWSK
jgi:transcriptional regulator with PAS, ATPase and Fis domain